MPTDEPAQLSAPTDAPPTPSEQPTAVVVHGDTRFTILGTAHVSRSSADEVTRLIESGRFDAVAIELDSGRHAVLEEPDRWAKTDLLKVLREGRAGMMAVNLALSAFQQRLADQFGIEPGAEMRAAIAAAKQRSLRLLLIDRDIGVTLRRVSASVGWWQRMNLFAGLVASTFTNEKIDEGEIERLKEGDVLESTFAEFAERSERIYTPLIAERDEYMAIKLLDYARSRPTGAPHEVLVVIGAGHLKGLVQHLEAAAPSGSRLQELQAVPPPSWFTKALPWLVLALVLAGFVVGFLRSPDTGLQLLADWSLVTAAMAAIGTAISLAHPLTILATAIAAPFTTLNPVLGAGFVAAGVELWLRKPSVGDFEALRKDVTTFKGWWRNRAARVLLVFVLATLGASAGTYIAGARLVGRLVGGGG